MINGVAFVDQVEHLVRDRKSKGPCLEMDAFLRVVQEIEADSLVPSSSSHSYILRRPPGTSRIDKTDRQTQVLEGQPR